MIFFHKNIRLHKSKYKGAQWHFITLCCAGRDPVFAHTSHATRMIHRLREFAIRFRFDVHAYCIMPDHFHALVVGLKPTSDLLAFVKTLKQRTSSEFQDTFHRALWQKKFYDHILRDRDAVAGVAAYIWLNPIRQKMCADAREYPYSGSFTIDWKKEFTLTETWTPTWKAKAPAFAPPCVAPHTP